MFSRVRSAFYNVVQNLDAFPVEDDQSEQPFNGTNSKDSKIQKFPYTRPEFLQLGSDEEIQVGLVRQFQLNAPKFESRVPSEFFQQLYSLLFTGQCGSHVEADSGSTEHKLPALEHRLR